MTRLWLDDERPAPAGWVHVRTASTAIELLAAGGVTEVSLDHDLGPQRTAPSRAFDQKRAAFQRHTNQEVSRSSATETQSASRAAQPADDPSVDPVPNLRRVLTRKELDDMFRNLVAGGHRADEGLIKSAIAAFDAALAQGHNGASTEYYRLLEAVTDNCIGDVLAKLDEDGVLEGVLGERTGWIPTYFPAVHYDERQARLFGAAGRVVSRAVGIDWDPRGPLARTWRVERFRGGDPWELTQRRTALREDIGRMQAEVRGLTALRPRKAASKKVSQ